MSTLTKCGNSSLHTEIQLRRIDPSTWPSHLPLRVPLHQSIEQYTKGGNGKVTCWFNPSAITWKGRNYMAFRCECFPFWSNGRIGVSEMTPDWRPDPGSSRFIPLQGRRGYSEAEDGRFLVHKGRVLLAYNTGSRQRMAWLTPEMHLAGWCEYEAAGFKLGQREKNWSFFSHDDQLYCIYTQSPHVILKARGKTVSMFHVEHWKIPWSFGTPRGGASPVLHDGALYHFFHSCTNYSTGEPDCDWGIQRKYHIGVAVLDSKPPFSVIGGSRLPIASGWQEQDLDGIGTKVPSNHAVLFPGSAQRNERNDGWLVAVGVNDMHSYMMDIPDKVVSDRMA